MTNVATGAKSYTTTNGATQYVGAAGQTYTGSTDWINGNRCNGVILSYNNSIVPAWAATPLLSNKCSTVAGVQSYNGIRTLARAMGVYTGSGDNEHIVSGYTECQLDALGNTSNCDTIGSGATNGVMFQTTSTLPVTSGHFYTFGVDTVYGNCASPASTTVQASDPQYQFQLVDSTGAATNIGSVLDGCRPSATRQQITVNRPLAVGAATTMATYVSSLVANAPFQYNSTTLGIKMYNASGVTNGNDGGFDNIKLLDVTPQLDKSFSPATISQGQNTVLTYTVTNTSDLLAKNGWHFVDKLPAGLSASGALGGSCVSTASSITAGTVDVTGNLAAGSASCTITVTVTSNTPGTYNNSGCVANNGTAIPNCTNNFPTITGINPPGTAPLTVLPVVDLSITKSATLAQYTPGSPITYTVTVHNNGPSDAINAVLTDPLPASVTGANWTCAVTAAGTANLPPTTGPTQCGAASGTGSITDTVRINTGGTLKYTVAGTVALATTGNLVNKATIVPAATTSIPNMPGGGPNPVTGSTTVVTTVDTNCPPSPGAGCSATVTTPPAPGVWNVAKTATVNGATPATNVVQGGDVITYTVKATGVSGLSSNAVLTDNLSNVLDDATFVSGSATLTVGGAAPVSVPNPVAPGNILTTGKFNLTPGVVASLSYQVTVKAGVWNKQLINVVTGTGDTPPTTCAVGVTPVAPVCTTTHITPAKVLIAKIGESGNAVWVPMAGSSWSVSNDNAGHEGTAYTGSGVTAVVPAATGQFQLQNIPVGTYWLSETAAPAGFSLLAEPVQFTIAANGAVTIGQGAGGGVVTSADVDGDGIFTITVRDVPALKMPDAGGTGTLPFMAGGSVLLLAAVALFVGSHRRRRRSTGSDGR
ncbi:DUF7927 domain-containing protein [Arthrobacter sp. ERGS1:01]|uniref:DUF7927 domain-containing protein n=1 Tax=Arthrobacter sp. ERGS1:01 TaxID=1704044 RepID=UPI0006B56975|nr:SpaA isopeptide-forming pilin-related protein [Arthrobacter sp. ERGS1:01]